MRGKIDMEKVVTLTQLTHSGDEVRKVQLKTLVAEKVLDLPVTTIINGKVVTTYDELLAECHRVEEPQVMQMPIVVGG